MNLEEHTRWLSVRGDETLRINYNLNNESIVFDLGGYKGEWSDKIYSRYKSKIYIFEPVQGFYNIIESKFGTNQDFTLIKKASSNINGNAFIELIEDSSSMVGFHSSGEEIELIRFVDYIINNKIQKIDLLKLNIEGAEYDLLEDLLLNSNLINIINNIQVQFHENVENYKEKRNKIREILLQTHKEDWNFEFVWEGWSKK